MKTSPYQFPVRNIRENIALLVFMIILFIVSLFQDAKAQSPDGFKNDPYFPGKHNFSTGLITTYRGSSVPAPVLIGDVTYGIGNRFSFGIVGGTIGTLALAGVKLAANIYQRENFRLLYRMTMIYYPERNGTFLFDKSSQHVMPWMLSMGLLDAEWKLKGGLRWTVGMGMLETHCIDGMMNLITGHRPEPEEEEDELPFRYYNTVQTSLSIPLSGKLTLRPEAIGVFQGTQFVHGDHQKVKPLNIYLNLVYTF